MAKNHSLKSKFNKSLLFETKITKKDDIKPRKYAPKSPRNALAFGKLKKRMIVKYIISKIQNIDKE